MRPRLSLIIPFYNEYEGIVPLVRQLNAFFTDKPYDTEVLFVDDGSTDKSVEALSLQPFGNFSVKLVRLSRNFGSHAALRAGILHSTGQYITFLCADLQDPLTLVDRLYEKAKEGHDIVFAFRKSADIGPGERLFSKAYAKLMRWFVTKDFPENGFDVVMIEEKVREVLNRHMESNSSLFLQLLLLGFRQASIPYDKQQRVHGRSKWTLSKKIKLFIDSFAAFSYFPIRLVSAAGILFFLLGGLWTVYIVLRTLIVGDLTPGWPALISILLVGFGTTNIMLGIVAEYLWRTLDASRNRPVFLVERITELRK